MSLSAQVLVGLFLGIATGIFFGEDAARLQFIGDAFIMLLQMTVMPFIAVSLVAALGRLDGQSARDLGLKAGTFLLIIWGLILAVVALLPIAFLPMQAGSFFSTSLVAEPQPFDLLVLYIPSDPIYALSHNVVPALVLFRVVLGVSIIPIQGKEGILRDLDVLTETLTRITGHVARLAPVDVFALISSAANPLRPSPPKSQPRPHSRYWAGGSSASSTMERCVSATSRTAYAGPSTHSSSTGSSGWP